MNVALIPLRGGSKSIPRKNIKEIAGKPLCQWVIEASASAEVIDQVYVSTDSDEIAEVVNNMELGVTVMRRPLQLASDEATTESVMMDFMGRVDFDTLVTIQATSPLLRGDDINAAFSLFERECYDSLLTAVRTKRFFWNDDGTPINYDPLCRPRRQEFPGTLMENGALYLTRKHVLVEHRCRLGGRIGVYEMSEETAAEIDEPQDWFRVERFLVDRQANRRNI